MSEFLANVQWLKQNDYPGRGIVMGLGADGERVQIYWIMGRSENSKNRIFVQNSDGSISTKAFDEKKLTDPSLIIYNPFKIAKGSHIISNGNQTDTIAEFLNAGKTFEDALKTTLLGHLAQIQIHWQNYCVCQLQSKVPQFCIRLAHIEEHRYLS